MASQTSYKNAGGTVQTRPLKLRGRDLPSKRLLDKGLVSIAYETEYRRKKYARKDFRGVPSAIFKPEAGRLVDLKDHENVFKTHGWTDDKMSCSLVLEYMEDDLSSLIQKTKESRGRLSRTQPAFKLQEALGVMLQTAKGMEHLHEQGILHGDLKTNNILVTQKNDGDKNSLSVKVADFGLSQTKRKSIPFVSRQVRKLDMVQWKAPECFNRLPSHLSKDNDETYSDSDSDSDEECTLDSSGVNDRQHLDVQACDVYSFAVTCSQILTGRNPYPNLNWKELGIKIVQSDFRPELPGPDSCPKLLSFLLVQCWDKVPSKRPTFSAICPTLVHLLASETIHHQIPVGVYDGSKSEAMSVQEPAIAMASSSRNDIEIEEELDDGQERNTTSWSDVVGASECADLKKQESGVPDEELMPMIATWSSKTWSLFSSVALCCSRASYSRPSSPSPSSTNPIVFIHDTTYRTASPSSASWYYSARIQRMIEDQDKISTEVEYEIKASKTHWSVVAPFEVSKSHWSELDAIEASKTPWSEVDATMSETEDWEEINCKYFEILKRRKYVREGDEIVVKQCSKDDKEIWGGLFRDMDHLVVGKKIGEGGQAEIYEAIGEDGEELALKVFSAAFLLQDLEKQWPLALLSAFQESPRRQLPGCIKGATLLKDERFFGRFAFVMDRCWGDLRELIDHQMTQSRNQGPPFTSQQILRLMFKIACDVNCLHMQHPPILHRDLRASNILVNGTATHPYLDKNGMFSVTVADFECSMQILGVGFWRAPEVHQNLRNKGFRATNMEYTKESDVYSFGMTCYELVTGCIPFEWCSNPEIRFCVLKGERPKLPPSLNPKVKEIITSCWHLIPSERPSFEDIVKKLQSMIPY